MTSAYVVGHDGSPAADAALDTAAKLGRADADRLVVVFVRHDQSALASSTQATAIHHQALDEIAAAISARLDASLADYPGQWQLEQHHGDPAAVLIEAARTRDADAIIVGHKGHSALVDLVVGSVAHSLLTHSPATVIVVRSAPVPAARDS